MEISGEMLMWIISVGMLICILWGVRYLIHMLNHSSKFGFGSKDTEKLIKQNTVALNELIRVAHWLYKRYNNDQEIPPASPQELSVNHEPPARPDF